MTIQDRGIFRIEKNENITVAGKVGDRPFSLENNQHALELQIPAGTHEIALNLLITGGSEWKFLTLWNGKDLYKNTLVTTERPKSYEKYSYNLMNITIILLLVSLLGLWIYSTIKTLQLTLFQLFWISSSSSLLFFLGQHNFLDRICVTLLVLGLLIPIQEHHKNSKVAYLLIGLPWVSYFVGLNFNSLGLFNLYTPGDDFTSYQGLAYTIFFEGEWFRGGSNFFDLQPLYRWIVGLLHCLFGDTSTGEKFLDTLSVSIMGMFVLHVVHECTKNFKYALASMVIFLMVFTIGVNYYHIGKGLQEIVGSTFAYSMGFFILKYYRYNSKRYLIFGGLFAMLSFFTRMDYLPFVLVLTFALSIPLSTPTRDWFSVLLDFKKIRYQAILFNVSACIVGFLILSLHGKIYGGMFRPHPFHFLTDSQDYSFLVVLDSILRIATVHEPYILNPVKNIRAMLVTVGCASALLSLMKMPLFGRLPMTLSFACLGGFVFTIIVPYWNAYCGRFSIHIIPLAVSLSLCLFFLIFERFKSHRLLSSKI
ncbi:MAG: glycosyltransferase family 39 protein [Oligoflexia bacterium]|nr:glycosyltransferase family 39 protein [Oligoflexia bacterium]